MDHVFIPFLIDFGSQNRPRIRGKWIPIWLSFLIDFWIRFFINFGSIFHRFWDQTSMKINSKFSNHATEQHNNDKTTSCKKHWFLLCFCDFAYVMCCIKMVESSIQRCMQNRLRNHSYTSCLRPRFLINFGTVFWSFLGPLQGPKIHQNRLKIDAKMPSHVDLLF